MGAIRTVDPAFYFSGGRHGVLLLHGFTGTPQTMRYLGERLRDAGYTVYAPTLPGHAQSIEAMARTGWHDWLDAAREAYAQLRKVCDRVTVVGFSMGGALACLLAEDYPVDGLVCLAAALKTRAKGLMFTRLIAPFVPVWRWNEQAPEERHGALALENGGYDGMPVRCLYDLNRLGRMARRGLYAVVAPTLIVQPLLDESVDPTCARALYEDVGAKTKKLVWLKDSRHLCATGPQREEVFNAILEHLRLIDDTESLAL